ncbi:hypothetical protein [Wolbachia endosymbiont (group A) of Agelastica alni]|uniref:hypothetical protein n=1 Tax=Wolbachia endosymbiont (group A) of Agelastica alni TaxID=3066130 RepID=UPI003132D573
MKVASFSCHPSAFFLSSQCPDYLDLILLYDDVMKVADTGFHPRGQCPLLSSQCSFFWGSSVTRWNDTFRINIKKFTK